MHQAKKIRESQSNTKQERNTIEKKWGVERWGEEREHGFYVIPIETDFYGKVYPSLVLHEI